MASGKTGPLDATRPTEDPGKRDSLGDALRNVYGDALGEDIPAEMLSLLGKLE